MTDTEREALCARIDELCAENERLHADQAHWELGNCPNCPNVASLQEALEQNAKLHELAERAWKTAELLCQAFDGPCRADDVTAYKPCPMGERDEECVYGQLQRELRELGVEGTE